MELERNRESLRRRGLGLAAISYDSVEALSHFARRRGVGFPLLSDPESRIIRAFGLFNESVPATSFAFGVPHPGLFLVDERGVVQARYFEEDYRERYTVSGILTAQFGEQAGGSRMTAETAHLSLTAAASASAVRAGQRVTLLLDVRFKPGMHAYAPGAPDDYIPLRWDVEASEAWKVQPPAWPQALRRRLLGEDVPVYEGTLRLTRDLTVGSDGKLAPLLDAQRSFRVTGSLRYQACDETTCFPPQTVPLEWKLVLEAADRERVPAHLQRKTP